MRTLLCLGVLAVLAAGQPAQRNAPTSGQNLPAQPIGANDLIEVSVYDAPEFSGTIRVDSNGNIRIKNVKDRVIKAGGLLPTDLETTIASTLKDAQMLVDPMVTVTIAEYHSRPITVSGAVKQPLTFQAEGPTSLLEAIGRAGGVSESAGPVILVTQMQPGADGKPEPLIRRVSKQGLIDFEDPALNLVLTGGEEVRVPEAPKLYVFGNVREPGAIKLQDKSETSVFEVLASAKGLAPYYGKVAYVYRADASGKKNEIAIPLDQILRRKKPDVPLMANDILYVPDRKGQRLSVAILERITTFGATAGATALIYK